MRNYWFQKKGKRRTPITWQGWALFAFVIGMIVNAPHIVNNNPIVAGIIAAIMAAIGYWLMNFKTAPDGVVVDASKSGRWPKILLGCVIGMVASLAIFFAILSAETWYNHKYIGSVKRTSNSDWITFHSIKDGFSVQLPSYPQYDHGDVPNVNTAASSYSVSDNTLGKFNVTLLPNVTVATSTSAALAAMYQGFRTSLESQGGQTDNASTTIVTFNSDPAIIFSFEMAKTGYTTEGMYALNSKGLYALAYGNDKDKFSAAVFDKFANSFHFDQATSTTN